MKVRMVLVVMACLLLATACGSSEPELDMSQAAIADRVEEIREIGNNYRGLDVTR